MIVEVIITKQLLKAIKRLKPVLVASFNFLKKTVKKKKYWLEVKAALRKVWDEAIKDV